MRIYNYLFKCYTKKFAYKTLNYYTKILPGMHAHYWYTKDYEYVFKTFTVRGEK